MSPDSGPLSPVKQALLTIETLQSKLDALERSRTEPIAVIGMGCRFPGGIDTPQKFWQLLCEGRDVFRELPPERTELCDVYNPDPLTPGTMYMRYGGFLEHCDLFDAQFFRISPREAHQMDPQQRLLLEVSWEALEHAGQAPDALAGSQTGVFVGVLSTDYAHLPGSLAERVDAHYYPGVNSSFLAGRLSYFLGLHGQSLVVDTACSSSLAAVHQACQSLRSGESALALAGGVNLMLSPEISVFLCKAGVISPTGSCRAFDRDADGIVRGEGCGVVVLKRLSDALAAGDTVHAVIRGTAVNHDGASGGLTVPNPRAQSLLYRTALRDAGVEPNEVSYIETHGTGTKLGDPVELRGLSQVFDSARSQPLYIGSVKTNLGHTDSAAGIAGLIKLVLMLKHGSMPPSLHFSSPNPVFTWDRSCLKVVREQTPWPVQETAPIAGVSAFGLSGMNAHAVLQAAPPPRAIPNIDIALERPRHVLTLSAQTGEALDALVAQYQTLAMTAPKLDVSDVCYTANTGRAHFSCRLAVVAASLSEIEDQLRARLQDASKPLARGNTNAPRVAFLFTGQGSQYVGMGRQLYATQPTFRRELDRCDAILRPLLPTPLLDVLYSPSGPEGPGDLHQTVYTQPALFALEYALATLWQSWGILPDAVMGHSVGEYVAACVAGVMSLEEGLTLISERGRLMQALPQDGAMMAVFATMHEVQEAMHPYERDVAIAAINGPRHIVLSGQRASIQQIASSLAAEGVRIQSLQVSHAFHSPLMEPMIAHFAAMAATVRYSAPRIDLVSNVTGTCVGEEAATPDYWTRHIRQPVQFAAGMATLYQQGCELFVEVGPKPILLAMGRECLPGEAGAWLPSLRRDREWDTLLGSLSELYERGVRVNWTGFDRDYARRKVELPNYPFQRQRYWVSNTTAGPTSPLSVGRVASSHPLLGQRLHLAESRERRYECQLSSEVPAYLTHHRVFGHAVLPAAAFLEMALTAGLAVSQLTLTEKQGSQHLALEDFTIHQSLILANGEAQRIQCTLAPDDTQAWSHRMHSTAMPGKEEGSEPEWRLHASGSIRAAHNVPPPPIDIEVLRSTLDKELSVPEFYLKCRNLGIEYGSSFQAIERAWVGDRSALAKVRVPDALADVSSYTVHPVLLDACMHVSLAALPEFLTDVYVPVSIKRLRLYRRPGRTVWSHVLLHAVDHAPHHAWIANVRLFDETGAVVADLEDLTLRMSSRAALLSHAVGSLNDDFYKVMWYPAPQISQEYERQKRTQPGHWVVLNDKADTGRQLASHLRTDASRCTLVSPGGQYEQLDEASFRIDPTNPDHYRRLFETLPDVTGVISPWSLDAPPDDFATALQKVCGTTLHLVHALTSLTTPPSLWLVTQGAIACPKDQRLAAGDQVPGIAQSPLWGLANVIALEHPELHCVRIDVDPAAVDVGSLCTAILSPTREDQIAIREHVHLTPRLIPARLPSASSLPLFQPDSAYLVVGGTRGLGLVVARWMVSKGAAYVVLMSRSGAVDAQELAVLERMGARVSVIRADVSDLDQTAKALAEIDRPLRGIIHAAGVLDDGIIQQQTLDRFTTVMAPKAQGAWHLHTLTEGLPLDFFVMFSSVASLLGSSGQANYAAANAFLDSLAHYRRSRGLTALTINWGGWSEVGEAARSEIRARMRATGLLPISPAQGLAALEQLLQQPRLDGAPAQVGITPIDWPTFVQHIVSGEVPPFLSQLAGRTPAPAPTAAAANGTLRRVLEEAPVSERTKQLSLHVSEQVAQVLGLANGTLLSAEQGFFALGMDSLLSLELRNRLQASLACALPGTLTFNYPTIAALVGYLAETIFAGKTVPQEAGRPNTSNELGSMIAQIEQMTDSDVQQLLRRKP